MANPTPTAVAQGLTGDKLIDAAIHGYKWNLTADRIIDWSVSGGPNGEQWSSPSTVKGYVETALKLISYYVNVNFNYVGSFSSPTAAAAAGSEINIALTANPADLPSNVWALGRFPQSSLGSGAGDIYYNAASSVVNLPDAAYLPGGAGFAMILHELGHTLGLKHPHDSGGTGHPTLTDIGVSFFDIDWFSVMSYNDDANWNLLGWNPATLMPMDILGLQYLYGPNLSTNAGDTTYGLVADNLYKTIWDASGTDLLTAANSSVGWRIELPEYYLSNLVETPVGIAAPLTDVGLAVPHSITWLMGDFEVVIGSRFADQIVGDSWTNTFSGGGGNDLIDGGDGFDTVVYDSVSTNYRWTQNSSGSWLVVDLRAGSPEGSDTLIGIESLSFTDRKVTLAATAPGPSVSAALEAGFQNILRAPSSWSGNTALATTLSTQSSSAAIAALVQQADATTSVATLAYQFFTGKIPSAAGMDYLVSPTGPNANNLNSAYYQSFNLENRYINFAVNLGKLGEGRASFEAAYGSKSLLDTIKSAYQTIYGSTPSDAKAHLLLDPRIDYFTYYGQDGQNGIGTKAAAVGWLLAEAAKADIGSMQTANIAFLTDLADGAAFAVNLVGSYPSVPFVG